MSGDHLGPTENRRRSTATPPDPEDGYNPYAAPKTEVGDESTLIDRGGVAWPVFLGMGILGGTFFCVFWSIGRSVQTRQDLLRILVGRGAVGGLLFGASFGVLMALFLRPATATFPIGDEDDFLSRLDGEMAKLRYRPLSRTDGLWTYGLKSRFRPHALDVVVRVGHGEATVAGPRANVEALKKRLER